MFNTSCIEFWTENRRGFCWFLLVYLCMLAQIYVGLPMKHWETRLCVPESMSNLATGIHLENLYAKNGNASW